MPSAVHTPPADGPDQARRLPVLIVGGGPAGLVSAYMLSKLGGASLCCCSFLLLCRC